MMMFVFFPQAFRAIKGFLDKLEKLSENPELLEEMGRYFISLSNNSISLSYL